MELLNPFALDVRNGIKREMKFLNQFAFDVRDGIKRETKFICLFGFKERTDQIIRDMIQIIGKNDCEICKSNPCLNVSYQNYQKYKLVDYPNEIYDSDKELEFEENEDEETNSNKKYMEHMYYIHKKLLIFQKDIFEDKTHGKAFIKGALSDDYSLSIVDRVLMMTKHQCNIIVCTDDITPILNDKTMYLRSHIVKV